MRPTAISDPDNDGVAALLDQIAFKTRPRASKNTGLPRPEIMSEGGAFMSWWKPSPWERIRLLCGANVRVMVNYGDHGPLNLDTMGEWGLSSPADW
jgi:hypothetical protein